MQEYKPFKSGKVREMYDIGDSIVMVATDRISAFDVILKNDIKKKGTVLTRFLNSGLTSPRTLCPTTCCPWM